MPKEKPVRILKEVDQKTKKNEKKSFVLSYWWCAVVSVSAYVYVIYDR